MSCSAAAAAAVLAEPSRAQTLRQELEKEGHFDLSRRVGRIDAHLALPITDAAAASFGHEWRGCRVVAHVDLPSSRTAALQTPFERLREKMAQLLRDLIADTASQPESESANGASSLSLSAEETAESAQTILDSDVPRKWERHGDLVLLPPTAFQHRIWEALKADGSLWQHVAQQLQAARVAVNAAVDAGLRRESRAALVLGESGWVTHVDNAVSYSFDVTKCMFSSGNITEKLRVANFDCAGQIVVDLYAGIGYFTLPYLVHAGAAYVHACEWNPHAAHALHRNLELNGVQGRCTVYEGDNAVVCPKKVADRVNLGLIPSSKNGWPVAAAALKETGGWMHLHENITVSSTSSSSSHAASAGERQAEFARAGASISQQIAAILSEVRGGQLWDVRCAHIECVKSYAPRIFHLVFDLECRPRPTAAAVE
eukprot:m.93024 g.93024  ORF g.93024 m.93024 type:complete len:428 (+) comp15354_c0_seq2:119-1402(+)